MGRSHTFVPLEIRCGQRRSSGQWMSVAMGECYFQAKALDCWRPAVQGSPPLGLLWKHLLIGYPLTDWSRLECWVSTGRMAALSGGSDLQMISNFVKLLRFFHLYCSIPCNLTDGDMKTGIRNIQWNSSKTYQDSPVSPCPTKTSTVLLCLFLALDVLEKQLGWTRMGAVDSHFLNGEDF